MFVWSEKKNRVNSKNKIWTFFWFFPKSEGKKISIDNIHLFVNKCFEESGKDGDQLNTNKSTWINASKCKLWGEMASEELPPLPHLSTSTFFKAFNESCFSQTLKLRVRFPRWVRRFHFSWCPVDNKTIKKPLSDKPSQADKWSAFWNKQKKTILKKTKDLVKKLESKSCLKTPSIYLADHLNCWGAEGFSKIAWKKNQILKNLNFCFLDAIYLWENRDFLFMKNSLLYPLKQFLWI